MRSLKTIINDSHRTGKELGFILIENLKRRVKGQELLVSDEQFTLLVNELHSEEKDSYSTYTALHDSLIHLTNLSNQTRFGAYSGLSSLNAMEDKICIQEVMRKTGADKELQTVVNRLTAELSSNLKVVTDSQYEMLFNSLTFIEAGNYFVEIVFNCLGLKDFDVFLLPTEDIYAQIERYNSYTKDFYKNLSNERLALGKMIFPIFPFENKKRT